MIFSTSRLGQFFLDDGLDLLHFRDLRVKIPHVRFVLPHPTVQNFNIDAFHPELLSQSLYLPLLPLRYLALLPHHAGGHFDLGIEAGVRIIEILLFQHESIDMLQLLLQRCHQLLVLLQ